MSGIAEQLKPRIQEQLDRVLASTTFAGSERHRAFLRFVVQQALRGDTDKLNEFVLGFEVFNKSESFDPRIDSIVRVEARRLRERLRKYYDEEGRTDPLVITLRPRSFVPEFREARSGVAAAPGGRPHWKWMAVGAAAVLALVASVAAWVAWRSRKPARPQTAALLVLPFQTVAPAKGQEMIGDAIVDGIITGLAGSPGLRVISRGSGVQFQESGQTTQQIATSLKLDYIVEGTVQPSKDRVRVSAKMTDVHTQSYVWAATREAAMDSLADLEREFTAAISSRIRIPLGSGGAVQAGRRRPANFEAYGTFLKGQYYWYLMEPGSNEKSVQLFEEATRVDPNYAPGWAWLAQAYQLMIMRDGGRDAALIAKGRQAAQKSLTLDDQLGEAHAAVASYADARLGLGDGRTRVSGGAAAESGLGPGPHDVLADVPGAQRPGSAGGGRDAAGSRTGPADTHHTGDAGRGLLLRPGSTSDRSGRLKICASRGNGQYPKIDDTISRSQWQEKGSGRWRKLSKRGSAIDERSPEYSVLGYLLAINGQAGKAREIRQRLLKDPRVPPLATAMVSVGLGDKEDVFRQLQAAVNARGPFICQAVVDPIFDPVRSDPRFADIVRAIGLKQ